MYRARSVSGLTCAKHGFRRPTSGAIKLWKIPLSAMQGKSHLRTAANSQLASVGLRLTIDLEQSQAVDISKQQAQKLQIARGHCIR